MTSPTYRQRVDRSDDRSAMLDKVHRARLRLAELENTCSGSEAQIRAAQSRMDSIPGYERGWMLEVIALLAVVAITLEWYPARMMTLVFFFASAVELVALTAAFAVGGFLLGLLLGELLRRHRKPQGHAALDWVILTAAVVAVAAFLTVGYELRFAFAQASNDAAQSPIGPVVQAAALTTLAFIGIVIAFTSGYYRESVEAMRMRWRLAGLHGHVKTSQRHLEATRAELEAAERAYRLVVDSEAAEAAGAASGAPATGPAPQTTTTNMPGATSPPGGAAAGSQGGTAVSAPAGGTSANGISSLRGEA